MNLPQPWNPGDYEKVEQAILFLERNFQHQPTLEEIAQDVRVSKFHFQRLFSRWAGISPKKFLQFLTLGHAKTLLAQSRSVLDTALDSGLSGPARLHDLFVTHEAVTPGDFKAGGAGVRICYGTHPTPFGPGFLAMTEKGVCGFSFPGPGGEAAALDDLGRQWPQAILEPAPGRTAKVMERIFRGANRSPPPLNLLLRGTPFQIKVWEALMNIPPGAVASYQDIARAAGRPGAVRAVGTAVGRNPVAFLIPCHRVIRKSGDFGGYRWGTPRKKAMLAWEAARAEAG